MGNDQSSVGGGSHFCSTSVDPLAERFMVDKDFRVDYMSTERNMWEQPSSKFEPFSSICHNVKVIPKNTSNCQNIFQNREYREQQQRRMCDGDWQQLKQEDMYSSSESVTVVPEDFGVNDETTVFEGIFGDVTLNGGHIAYKDGAGREYQEVFNAQLLQRTFPMGISLGGLSRSILFKDVRDRDACFDKMTGDLPPSYVEKISNPAKYSLSITREFNGINGYKIVVHPDSRVFYYDIDGEKYSARYNRYKISKCFPHGICFGGLPKTIWLKDESERDRCHVFMQMNRETEEIEEPSEEKALIQSLEEKALTRKADDTKQRLDEKVKDERESEENVPAEKKIFRGLYGNVVLKANHHEVEYTSLMGDRVSVVWYDPLMIRKVFPMGITDGGLTSTIWFSEMEDMENCLGAMKAVC